MIILSSTDVEVENPQKSDTLNTFCSWCVVDAASAWKNINEGATSK